MSHRYLVSSKEFVNLFTILLKFLRLRIVSETMDFNRSRQTVVCIHTNLTNPTTSGEVNSFLTALFFLQVVFKHDNFQLRTILNPANQAPYYFKGFFFNSETANSPHLYSFSFPIFGFSRDLFSCL